MGVRLLRSDMIGTHLIADFYGVAAARLNDESTLSACLLRAARCCRLTPLGAPVLHAFEGGGVTGFILLAESHIALHSYPEHGYLALDIFSCGDGDIQNALDVFRAALEPREVRVACAPRGTGVNTGVKMERLAP